MTTTEDRDDRFTLKFGDVFVHGPGEHWVGPFQVRDYLGNLAVPRVPMIPSAYVITRNSWEGDPLAGSEPLYVGRSSKLLLRVGQLLTDAFGFYTCVEDGHSSGGQSLHKWCLANGVSPLDLHLAWIEGTQCHKCLETRIFLQLEPHGKLLNKKPPDRCSEHKL